MSHRNSLRGYLRYTPIVLLLLALMVSATVVVPQGLAQSHEPPAGKLLIFVWGGPPDIESQQAAFDRYMELYPQVEIEMIHTQPECGADYAACKTFIAGGAMADVFVPGSWNYNAMALDGVLEDLGPYIERDGLNLVLQPQLR
jgi:ABC-type glycerol-3-phosphate transport system substrate-binding protein